MRLSKHIFALILSMVMLLSAASITAFGEYAITPDTDDNLEVMTLLKRQMLHTIGTSALAVTTPQRWHTLMLVVLLLHMQH